MCELDKQGRILVPQTLREFAGLEKRAWLVTGNLNRVEVWSKEKWSENCNFDRYGQHCRERGKHRYRYLSIKQAEIQQETEMEFKHKSVLYWTRPLAGLTSEPDGIYVDGTLGGAGHAIEVCRKLSAKGRFIGIDQDQDAIIAASERLADL